MAASAALFSAGLRQCRDKNSGSSMALRGICAVVVAWFSAEHDGSEHDVSSCCFGLFVFCCFGAVIGCSCCFGLSVFGCCLGAVMAFAAFGFRFLFGLSVFCCFGAVAALLLLPLSLHFCCCSSHVLSKVTVKICHEVQSLAKQTHPQTDD